MRDHKAEMEQKYKTAHLSESKRGLLYHLAWEHGHAFGESEVELYYAEFTELALCE